jgi:hypothetical protein
MEKCAACHAPAPQLIHTPLWTTFVQAPWQLVGETLITAPVNLVAKKLSQAPCFCSRLLRPLIVYAMR